MPVGVEIHAADLETLNQPSVLPSAVSLMVLLLTTIGPDVHPARAICVGVGMTPAIRGARAAIVGQVAKFYSVALDVEVLSGAAMRNNVRGQRYL